MVKEWVYDGKYARPFVRGAVLMGGRMFSGGRVIRASHAQVIALSDGSFKAKGIAQSYAVRTVPWDGIRDYATEFGAELTDEQVKELHAQ